MAMEAAPINAALTAPCMNPTPAPVSSMRGGSHSHIHLTLRLTLSAWKLAPRNANPVNTIVHRMMSIQMSSTVLRKTAFVEPKLDPPLPTLPPGTISSSLFPPVLELLLKEGPVLEEGGAVAFVPLMQ